jgi:hypothetical protein
LLSPRYSKKTARFDFSIVARSIDIATAPRKRGPYKKRGGIYYMCEHGRQKIRCKECEPGLPQEVIQRGVDIGLMEPCWMRPPASPENFAHLCLIENTKRTNQSAPVSWNSLFFDSLVANLSLLYTSFALQTKKFGNGFN